MLFWVSVLKVRDMSILLLSNGNFKGHDVKNVSLLKNIYSIILVVKFFVNAQFKFIGLHALKKFFNNDI